MPGMRPRSVPWSTSSTAPAGRPKKYSAIRCIDRAKQDRNSGKRSSMIGRTQGSATGMRSALKRRALHVVGSAALLSMVAVPIASFASSTSAGAASFPKSHTLNLSFLEDPGQPPDPDVYYAGEGIELTRNMYEGLLTYKPGTANRVIEPELATSWTISQERSHLHLPASTGCDVPRRHSIQLVGHCPRLRPSTGRQRRAGLHGGGRQVSGDPRAIYGRSSRSMHPTRPSWTTWPPPTDQP